MEELDRELRLTHDACQRLKSQVGLFFVFNFLL